MKGTPELPQCGFSRASIQVLGRQGVDPAKFSAFNVLENEELRQGIAPSVPRSYSSHAIYVDIIRYQRILGLADDSAALRRQ